MHEYILGLSKEELIEKLKDDKIRQAFLEDKNHYPFIWTIQGLKDEIEYFLDHDYLVKIMNSNRGRDKFVAILTSCNDKVNDILLYDDVINYILNDSELASDLVYLNYKVGKAIIDFDIKYNKNHLQLLGKFNKNEQFKIFSEDYIIKLLEYKNVDSTIFRNLDDKVINKLLTYEKFLSLFLELSIDDINRLVELHNLKFSKELCKNQKLIDKYVSLNTNLYRVYLNNLLKDNYEFSEIIEQNRKDKIDTKIHNIKNDKFLEFTNLDNFNMSYIYKHFNYKKAFKISMLYQNKDYDKLSEMFKEITKEEVIVMVIDTLFKDIPYNFLKNLKTIINYSMENKEYIPKNIDIYRQVLDFDKLDINEIINFFDKYKNKDLATDFYDDYTKAKNTSYQKLNEAVLDLNSDSKVYNLKLSEKYKRDVYYLDGEDFKLFIHASTTKNWNIKKTISISMISNLNIAYYNDQLDPVVFGFNNLTLDNIIHVYNADSYTMQMNSTDKVSFIDTPDNLALKTIGYNEILYKEYDGFKPDFIVCFDEIKQRDLEIAEKLDLKIVLINFKKYNKEEELEYIDSNTYLDSREIDVNTYYDVVDEIKQK